MLSVFLIHIASLMCLPDLSYSRSITFAFSQSITWFLLYTWSVIADLLQIFWLFRVINIVFMSTWWNFSQSVWCFFIIVIIVIFRVVAEKKMTPKELEEFMARVPQDDVWLREHYPPPKYRLTDTLRMHRELACLEMQDNMKGLLYARLQLDMSKKKKVTFYVGIFPSVCWLGIYNEVWIFELRMSWVS